jgi:hypothetical protein
MKTALAILILVQGIITTQVGTGTVSGVLRSESGIAVKGIRVTDIGVSDPAVLRTSGEMLSITETGEAGEFLLENVPPGKYYVVAGSIASPTYYPGALDVAEAALVSVSAGAILRGIDFRISENGISAAQNARQSAVRGG